jgi:hypothetical protein
MISIPLGKIAVPTPGTPVPITLTNAQKALLPPSGLVHKVEVWPDPADTGVSKVLVGGVQVAGLPSPGTAAGGHAQQYEACSCDGNGINPLAFSVDNTVATNGPFVTLWVE